jgi:hypothetical protein
MHTDTPVVGRQGISNDDRRLTHEERRRLIEAPISIQTIGGRTWNGNIVDRSELSRSMSRRTIMDWELL